MRRVRPLKERFWKYVNKTERCWIWTGSRNLKGYGVLQKVRQDNGTTRNILAHRMSWELHKGPIPEGLLVLHRCDNPGCVRIGHLFLGTHKDNTQDMIRKGRSRLVYITDPRRAEKIPREPKEYKIPIKCFLGHKFSKYGKLGQNGTFHCKLCDMIKRLDAQYTLGV